MVSTRTCALWMGRGIQVPEMVDFLGCIAKALQEHIKHRGDDKGIMESRAREIGTTKTNAAHLRIVEMSSPQIRATEEDIGQVCTVEPRVLQIRLPHIDVNHAGAAKLSATKVGTPQVSSA